MSPFPTVGCFGPRWLVQTVSLGSSMLRWLLCFSLFFFFKCYYRTCAGWKVPSPVRPCFLWSSLSFPPRSSVTFFKEKHFFVKFLPHLRHVQLCSSLNHCYGRNRVRQTWQTEKMQLLQLYFPFLVVKSFCWQLEKGRPSCFSLFFSLSVALICFSCRVIIIIAAAAALWLL